VVSAILDKHGVEDFIRLEDSVVARLTLDQMTNVYNDITLLQQERGLLVTFESVPRQTYEMGLQPWEVGELLKIEEYTWRQTTDSQVVAIVVDQSIYSDIQSAISTYVSDVAALYDNVTLLVYQSSAATPESLRGFLQSIHQSQGIQGAILVGSLPYARWELPWGEECSLPLFYENLDDIFLDQDSDGLYDYHDWGSNEGVEIWVSWIRPPSQDPVSALRAYFDKTHDYYSGAYWISRRGLLVITHDWWGAGDPMREAFAELFGEDVDQLGGCEGCYAKLEPYLQLYTNNDYAVQNLWAHSCNVGHQFDSDPGEPNWLSSTDLAALPRGPQFSVIWGCHVMDFTGDPGDIFATRYLMGTHNGLAALGVTRGIGTPAQELLIPMLSQSANLGDAVFQYLNLVTAQDYIYEQYPDELHTFVWDIALVGDPFLFFDTTPPSGQILTPVEGAFLNEDSVYIEAEASDNLGIDQVQFFAWYNDNWHYIDNDTDGSDGYQTTWDVSGLSDRSGIWLDALILDLVWNRWDATVGNLTLDRTPPTGDVSINDGATYAASTAVTLNLVGTDTGAGVDQVMMSNDASFSGATWVTYATSLDWMLAAGDGTRTVYVKFRDRAGNESTVYSDTIILDMSAPTGSILIQAGTGVVTDTQVMLTLSASDANGVTQMRFSNDGTNYSAWMSYTITSPWALSSGDGTKTVYVKFRDQVGNVSTVYSDTIVLDMTSPTGSVVINDGAVYAASRAVTLTLAANDSGTGVDQMMVANNSGFGGAMWMTYTTPLNWTLTAGDDTKTVYAEFRDRAGNESIVTYSDTIILDTTAPTGSILIQGVAEVVTSTQVVLALSASDTHGVTHMRLRNDTAAWGAWEPFTTSRMWTLAAREGERTVGVQFRDPVGNVSAAYSDSVVYQFPYHIHLPLVLRNRPSIP